jgi:transposase
MPRLSEAEKNQAIGMLMVGASVVDVSRMLNSSRNTGHELIRRYRLTGDVQVVVQGQLPKGTTV